MLWLLLGCACVNGLFLPTNKPDTLHIHPDVSAQTADAHVKDGVAHGGHAVAIGMIATSVMLPITVHFVCFGTIRAVLTWKLLDTSVAVFLAVLWFNAFGALIHAWLDPRKPTPEILALVGLVKLVILYIGVLVCSFWLRNNRLVMAAFVAIGAQYVSFAGIHTSSQGQFFVFTWFKEIFPADWATLIYCLGVLLLLLLSYKISRYVRQRKEKTGYTTDEGEHSSELLEYEKTIEHLDVELGALICSFLIIQTIRLLLTDQYPPVQLLQENIDPKSQVSLRTRSSGNKFMHTHGKGRYVHTQYQTNIMLAVGIGLGLVTSLLLRSLHDDIRFLSKFQRHFIRLTLVMLVAWCFLLWGQWQFIDRFSAKDELFGLLSFALLVLGVTLFFIQGFSMLYQYQSSRRVGDTAWLKSYRDSMLLSVSGMSLVVAWSWEHSFDMALDVFGEMYNCGFGGLIPKTILAVLVPCVTLPVYVHHIRPRAEMDMVNI